MISVFTVFTSHRTVLSIGAHDQRVCHRPPLSSEVGTGPLRLVTTTSDGTLYLPLGMDAATERPIIPVPISRGNGLLLQVAEEPVGMTLRSAATQRYLSAIPGGTVEANRARAAGWECFTLESDHAGTFLADLQPVLARVYLTVTATMPWAEKLAALLLERPDAITAAMVDAVWPMLTVDEMDDFAERLRDQPAVLTRLQALFADDFFAMRAIPTLLGYLSSRESSASRGPLAAPGNRAFMANRAADAATPWQWLAPTAKRSPTVRDQSSARSLGPEFDHLAQDGYDGWLSSLGHAANASLRRAVKPSQGVAIVASARSEGVYLLEWIAHHRLLGIEAFFLYTNNNDDESDALLDALHSAGVITWIRSEVGTGISAQNKAYGHALNVALNVLDHRWALFIDLDEFLVLNEARYRTVAEFIRWHEMRETDAVGINWVMVSSSGEAHWTDTPLVLRNPFLLGQPNAHIKTMAKPCKFIQAHPHFPFADQRRGYTFRVAGGELHEPRLQPAGIYHRRAFSDEPSDADACLYHYFFKSIDEFVWKSSRNRGDLPLDHGVTFKYMDAGSIQAFMDQHGSTDIRQSRFAGRSSTALLTEMARLRAMPGVETAEQTVRATFAARLEHVKRVLLRSDHLRTMGEVAIEFELLLRQSQTQAGEAEVVSPT